MEFLQASVLIPAFNAVQWIRQTVESALTQNAKEVIVVDDGSTDGTLDVLRTFGNAIQVHAGEHKGGNAARNQLLSLASAEWVQFLDADDYLLPGKIAGQMQFIKSQPQAPDVVYSPLILRFEDTGNESQLPIGAGDEILHFIQWGPFQTSSMLWRRSAVLELGGWNETQRACQEHELLLRFIRAGKRFGLYNEAATVYRLLSGTVSRKNPLLTIQLRMELTDKLEAFLKQAGRLDPVYKQALYTARMEAARSSWLIDRDYAGELARKANAGGRAWVSSDALPIYFQLSSRLFGFQIASRLALLKRQLM